MEENIKNGSIIAVPISSLSIHIEELEQAKVYGFELLGKLFKYNNHTYIILRYADRNQSIPNYSEVAMLHITSFRKALPEEKKVWEKSKYLFTTTMQVNYPNTITVLTHLTIISAIRRWCTYYNIHPTKMNKVIVTGYMRSFAITKLEASVAYLFQRGLELNINKHDIEANKTYLKHDLCSLLPEPIKGSLCLYALVTLEIELVWNIACNIKRISNLTYNTTE